MRDSVGGLLARSGSAAADAGVAAPGATPKGAGAVGAGMLAKLAGVGAAGKAALACVGGGAIAGVCVAAGVGPLDREEHPRDAPVEERPAATKGPPRTSLPMPDPPVETTPHEQPPGSDGGSGGEPAPEPTPEPEPVEPAPAPPPPPPSVQQFGVAPTSSSEGGSSAPSDRDQATAQEFGP
jgi:hypothetical protein